MAGPLPAKDRAERLDAAIDGVRTATMCG